MTTEKIQVLRIKNLGLAAFAKIQDDCHFEGYDDTAKCFKFKTSKSFKQLETAYLNSCCYKHDLELMSLRNLFKKK